MDDIAVIGIGLRFPGDASSPEELWKVLEKGESQWAEFPKDRLNIDGYYHPGGDRQGSISFKGAHFLEGDIAAFDAPFFSVSTKDAKAIDPQQRILLEASYEALENAGLRKEDVEGSDTAVYVGSFVKDYEQVCLRDPDWQPQYAATGNGIAIMANRISYAFDFHGPSMTIDTGCSGSLVSVHLAAQNLRNGDCSLALAAGAGMIMTPNTIMPMTALNFLSPDGKCFTFDERANGYGRGEGIGVVVLKRVSDAIRDNDTIRAIIRGSRVNQDGRTTGITLPSKEAQVANIRALYDSSGLDYKQTAYVECHGTGTQAGDWRELKAISETLGTGHAVEDPIVVGSLKPNIGHLEGAAGVAGLIKGVLVLEHGKIPPNINFKTPNPDIDFTNWRVKVPTSVMDWPKPGVRRVSVNCFGFGGTNAHVIMDEAPAYLKAQGLIGNHESLNGSHHVNGNGETDAEESQPHLFIFSSNEKSGIRRVLESQIRHMEAAAAKNHDFLTNYAYTLGCRRSVMEWKTSIVASSADQLAAKMRAASEESIIRSSSEKAPRICLVFCGQGAQWAGMGQDLMAFEPFRHSIQAASEYMRTKLNSPFLLVEEMFKPDKISRIGNPEISQPATTAIQIALVELLDAFSIVPHQVIGHSSGEIAAAFATGALSREDAWKVAYYRGFCAANIPKGEPPNDDDGMMMAVGWSVEEAEEHLRDIDGVQVACINSQRSVTLSGQAAGIRAIHKTLQDAGVFNRILPVKTAYHSHYMKLVANDYQDMLRGIKTRTTNGVAMFSSVTGKIVTGEELAGEYWVENMVSPVQYLSAVRKMLDSPAGELPSVIVELSPRAALKSPTADILAEMEAKRRPAYLSALDRKTGSVESVLQLVGELWTRGQKVDMQEIITCGSNERRLKCLVDLPPYPWNHTQSYWHESHLGKANRFREYPRQDLIGAPTADAIPFEPRWRGFLRVSENPWIQDHQVQKTVIYPAAGMVSMVLEGARQTAKDQVSLLGFELVNMQVEKAMIIPSTAHGLEVALNIKQDIEHLHDDRLRGSHEFAVYSKQLDAPWERHATGFLRFRYNDSDANALFMMHGEKFKALKGSCKEDVVPRQLYELLDTVGMNYGSLFQNIAELRKEGNSCVSKVRIPDTKSKMPAKFEYPHLIHPATLDSMFHTLFAIEPEPMVPTFIESLFVSNGVDRSNRECFQGYSTADREGISGATANIAMWLDDTDSCVIIKGLHLTGISGPTPQDGGFLPNHRNLCTEIIWEEDVAFAEPATFNQQLMLLSHKYPDLAVLQIGGQCSDSLAILDMIAAESSNAPRLSRYSIADLGSADADLTKRLLEESELQPYVESVKVDGSQPIADYHCILAFPDSGVDVNLLKKHLKAGGWVAKIGNQQQHAVNGKKENGQKPLFGSSIVAADAVLESAGHGELNLLYLVLLYADGSHDDAATFEHSIRSASSQAGIEVQVSSQSLSQASSDTTQLAGKVILSVLDLDQPAEKGGFIYNWTEAEFVAFHAVQKACKEMLWITQGANMDPRNPKASPIVALARTLMSEDPQKTFATIDLDVATSVSDEHVARMILKALVTSFGNNSSVLSPRETEYAERGGKVYIPRLAPVEGLNRLIENDTARGEMAHVPFFSDRENRSLRLHVSKPGLAAGSLYFVDGKRSEPLETEVQVRFKRSELSFKDLKVAQGLSTDGPIGMDVAGRVTRVGHGVSNIEIDTEVVALVPRGAIQSVVNVDASLVVPVRPGFVPSWFVSAYYGLVYMARIQAESRVLIHAGASCFGRAALTLCSAAGAEAVVTVVGDGVEAQRDLLIQAGVSEDRIIDENTDGFVEAARGLTGGNGFDAVYNPTSGHGELSVECVRTGGTVVQLEDRSSAGTRPKAPLCGAYVSFSLAQLLDRDPKFVGTLLREAFDFLEGEWVMVHSVKNPEFEVGRVGEALSHLAKAPYLGGVSVVAESSAATLNVPVLPTDSTKPLHEAINSNGTYLLAGGLGGLGRSISELLIANGARHLAFLSRSGASTDQAKAFISDVSSRGVKVQVFCADICDREALADVIKEQVTAQMPPIVGVFQCAAIINDAVFDNMTHEAWVKATRPKMQGSSNIVECLEQSEQDPFYIFLASSAGVIGNRGQANYAAGNHFEDSLARNLRIKRKHAVAIDLGPVLGAGMLAEDEEILDMLRASGFYGIRHEDFLKVVTHAITKETLRGVPMPPQVSLGVGSGGLILQNQPADPYWSRTALYRYMNLVDMPPPDLAVGSAGPSKDMKTMLAQCGSMDEAADVICTGLMNMLAKAMNMLFEEMDAGKAPNAYGVDSLVAVGVRNWIYSNCGVEVSVFEVLSDKTVSEMAVMIAERGQFGVRH